MKTVLQVTSVPIRSLFVFSIQLLPVFTCYLQSVCRTSLSIPTSLQRNFLGDSKARKARTPTSSLLTNTELDYIGITFLSLLMDKKRITWKLNRKLNKNPYISIILSLILPGRYLEDGRPLANWMIDVEKKWILTHECCTLPLTFLFWLVKAEIT